jgi:hypothetical protein
MPESSKEAWDEVGERFGAWGRMLADRYKLRGTETETVTEEDRRKLEEAFQAIVRQLEQAFSALGEQLRDPEAKEGLKQAARSFGDALGATASEVSGEIRKHFGSSGSSGSAGDAS